jgi:hypothetical protein
VAGPDLSAIDEFHQKKRVEVQAHPCCNMVYSDLRSKSQIDALIAEKGFRRSHSMTRMLIGGKQNLFDQREAVKGEMDALEGYQMVDLTPFTVKWTLSNGAVDALKR